MRKRRLGRWIALLVWLAASGACAGTCGGGGNETPQPTPDILVQLQAIPGMTALEGTADFFGYRYFELQYEQPTDHDNAGGETFEQHAAFLFWDRSAPTVLVTRGYNLGQAQFRKELTQLLEANQLWIEHRYFEPSRPASSDWSKLTIEQAAADHHRFVENVRPLTSGPWINTGASKGGMTAVYHRRFYPDDVDGTVAYVAPLSLDAPDARYVTFFDSVGPAACRQAVQDIQREVLVRRTAMLTLAADAATQYGLTFSRMPLDLALEIAAGDLQFAFWQYGTEADCASVPTLTATDQEVFDFFANMAGFWFYSDEVLAEFAPYYYQAYAQLGYPAIPESHISDLYQTDHTAADAAYLPAGVSLTYDPAAMADIDTWVQNEGSRLLLVYGQNDPWSAGAFRLGGATESGLFVQASGNHGSSIAGLDPADRAAAFSLLEAWTGVTPASAEALDPAQLDPFERLEPPLLRP